jgi:hypothetical protein
MRSSAASGFDGIRRNRFRPQNVAGTVSLSWQMISSELPNNRSEPERATFEPSWSRASFAFPHATTANVGCRCHLKVGDSP